MASSTLMFSSESECPSGQPSQKHQVSGPDRTTSLLPGPMKPEDFLVLPHVLGKGGSATVKLAIHKPTRTQFAVKKISLTPEVNSTILQQAQTELDVQEELNHPHLLKLFGHFYDETHLHIVLELVKGQNLFSLIRKHNGLSEEVARPLFRQVCLGIQHLHAQHITHRDVKPENVLVDTENYVKLCDFGCAVRGTARQYKVSGTLEYLAPEILLEVGATNKVDCWALGVLLFEMLHGQSPFKGTSEVYTARKIIRAQAVFKPTVSAEACSLITALLEKDPENRLSADEILKHPWLHTPREDCLSERATADSSPLLPPTRRPKKASNLRSQMLIAEREAELLKLQQVLEAPQPPKKPSSWFSSLIRRLL